MVQGSGIEGEEDGSVGGFVERVRMISRRLAGSSSGGKQTSWIHPLVSHGGGTCSGGSTFGVRNWKGGTEEGSAAEAEDRLLEGPPKDIPSQLLNPEKSSTVTGSCRDEGVSGGKGNCSPRCSVLGTMNSKGLSDLAPRKSKGVSTFGMVYSKS